MVLIESLDIQLLVSPSSGNRVTSRGPLHVVCIISRQATHGRRDSSSVLHGLLSLSLCLTLILIPGTSLLGRDFARLHFMGCISRDPGRNKKDTWRGRRRRGTGGNWKGSPRAEAKSHAPPCSQHWIQISKLKSAELGLRGLLERQHFRTKLSPEITLDITRRESPSKNSKKAPIVRATSTCLHPQ